MSDVIEQQQESVMTPADPAVNDGVSPDKISAHNSGVAVSELRAGSEPVFHNVSTHDVQYTQSVDNHAGQLQTASGAADAEKGACTEKVTTSLQKAPARSSAVKSGRVSQTAKSKKTVSNPRGVHTVSPVGTDNTELSLSASTDKEIVTKEVPPAGSKRKQRTACAKQVSPIPAPKKGSAEVCKSLDGNIEESSYVPIINNRGILSSSDKVLAESLRHGAHVARLAGALFDQLQELHKLDEDWRRRLIEAARLHDIGFVSGAKGHHKASMKRINDDMSIELSAEDRPLVAQLARYHRKAWPSRRHRPFAALPRESRKALRRAAALLRIADGLDYTHQSLVTEIHVKKKQHSIVLVLKSKAECREEMQRAVRKSDLFAHLFRRQVECECQPD